MERIRIKDLVLSKNARRRIRKLEKTNPLAAARIKSWLYSFTKIDFNNKYLHKKFDIKKTRFCRRYIAHFANHAIFVYFDFNEQIMFVEDIIPT